MKGEVRNPTTVWLLALVTCGLYGLYWYYTMGNELKNYLGKEDLNPVMDIVIGLVCGLYMLYMPIKYGKIIQEAQMRAGVPNPEDQGVKFLLFMFLCSYGYAKMQEELNRIWEAGGGAPATF
jgi:hypothetical protein